MPASLSQIRAWSTEHLTNAASYWITTANQWENTFLQMRNQSHTIAWQGDGGDGLRQRTGADLSIVSGKADQLRQAAGIARNGASQSAACRPQGRANPPTRWRPGWRRLLVVWAPLLLAPCPSDLLDGKHHGKHDEGPVPPSEVVG